MNEVAEDPRSTLPQDVGRPGAHAPSPQRIFRREVALARIAEVAAVRDELSRDGIAVVFAYSVKTNPRRELLEAARRNDFLAEVISLDELTWSLENGFAVEDTIYNGPQPLLDTGIGAGVGTIFADSLEAFRRNAVRGIGRQRGVRLRPSMIQSRFGVAAADDRVLAELVAATDRTEPFAVSFHTRPEDFRGASWRDVAADVVERARALQLASGRPIVTVDVGGGWTPAEFDAQFAGDARWLLEYVARALPACTQLIVEAGQAICTPAEALVGTVTEVRERRGGREAVVDIGYPDWPQMHTYRHGLFVWQQSAWAALGYGADRLLGRTCLEYDLVEGVRLPHGLSAGDRILITDTGSYDSAMAFRFARGGAKMPAPS